MKFNKKLVVLAAAGALGAVTAMPAMAFENEFHGAYTLKYYLSNYETGAGGALPIVAKPGTFDATQNLRMNNYFEQRARIFYTAKANDDLKLVTAFEIDSVWGDKAQGSLTAANSNAVAGTTTAAFRNSGGALEADAVNLETKWVYLDFKIPSTPTRVTAGIQPFKDQLKGIFLDADVAGVLAKTSLNDLTLNVGYLRAYDQSFFSTGAPVNTALPRGNENLDIGVVEAKYAVNKDVNVGLAYYLYADSRPFYASATSTTPLDDALMIHTIGLTGEAKIGMLNVSGFAAYQGGVARNVDRNNNSAYLNAIAYNVAAKAAVGPGTVKTALLFTSGNDQNASDRNSKHLTGWVGTTQSPNSVWAATTGTSTYNESGMMLLNRNALNNNTSTDYALVYNPGNGSSPTNMQGLYLYTLGYDAVVTPKCYANANVGFAWAAHTNNLKPTDKVTDKQNASNFMGTEINIETGYKMYDNLTAKVQAAYVILGGYYKNSVTNGAGSAADPENPYTARLILSYAF